jgi:hypothetical protein
MEQRHAALLFILERMVVCNAAAFGSDGGAQ